MDAILDLSDPEQPREPEWPEADYLIGNPPFLGGKLLRRELGDAYVDRFFAESDRPWVLDGANVHVSMVAFDAGSETHRVLYGRLAPSINANLTSTADLASAVRLPANARLAFMGDTKGGSFDLDESVAVSMLSVPNPHGRPNSDVLVPWVNGKDLTGRARRMWIIDFGVGMSEETAAKYADPFEHILEQVKPLRAGNAREAYRRLWWQHVEARSGMQVALRDLPRFAGTARVSKHRLFVWLTHPTDASMRPSAPPTAPPAVATGPRICRRRRSWSSSWP